jgi:hypothetical protein
MPQTSDIKLCLVVLAREVYMYTMKVYHLIHSFLFLSQDTTLGAKPNFM